MHTENRRNARVLMPLLLAMLCASCATHSPPVTPPPVVVKPAQIPQPDPALMSAPPSESYSARALRNIRLWLQTLMASERDS